MLAVSSLPEYEITKRADLSYVGVAFNGFIVQLHIYIFFLMKRWAVPLKRQEVGHKATPQESSNVKGTEILARPVELDTVKFSDRVPGPVTPEILKSQISQPETS